DRDDAADGVPAAGHLRQRRRQPGRRAGEPNRGGAEAARQELRVSPLRRRRARLLLQRAAELPPGAGGRRLAEGLGVLREESGPTVTGARRALMVVHAQPDVLFAGFSPTEPG